jgi:hypothetical protein
MANIRPDIEHPERRESAEGSIGQEEEEERRSAKLVAGGSLTEAIAGIAAAALAIIGLAGTLPIELAAVATIAVGVALLAQGGAVAARWSRLVHETQGYEWDPRTELGSGMSAEILGGAAGVVLGILALIGLAPLVLIAVALLVFGGALLVGSGTTVDLGSMRAGNLPGRFAHTTREASLAASGTQMLVGVGVIVLGILALVGTDPATLALVGLLALGASILFSGSAVTSRMYGILHR